MCACPRCPWQKRSREGDTTTPWWFPSETKGGSIREDRLVLPIPPDTHWSEAKPVVLPDPEPDPAAGPLSGERAPKARHAPKPLRPSPPKALCGFSFASASPPPAEKPKPPKERVRNDPKRISAARELRDRYLDAVNADPSLLLASAKYEVARALPAAQPATPSLVEVKLLPAA
jgi:hypothetical protein